jgi:hypothetical protein
LNAVGSVVAAAVAVVPVPMVAVPGAPVCPPVAVKVVEVEKINNNIYFNVWTEQPYFKHGEPVKYMVTANKVGNVYIFNYHGNRYYNIFQKKITQTGLELELLEKNQKLIAKVQDGKYVSKEKMVFVFTDLDIKPKPMYNDFEMNNFIRSLPVDRRKIISRVAQIVR